jgi:uncharacterized tellurite resistance protein B-like protein
MNEKNKQLFLDLYQMILADGEVHSKELDLLYAIGNERGISQQDIQGTLFSSNEPLPVQSLTDDEKIAHLYNLAQMAIADEKDDDKNMENEILKKVAERFGFDTKNIPEIIKFLLGQAEAGMTTQQVLHTIKNA